MNCTTSVVSTPRGSLLSMAIQPGAVPATFAWLMN